LLAGFRFMGSFSPKPGTEHPEQVHCDHAGQQYEDPQLL
jgi:hypothetical protein